MAKKKAPHNKLMAKRKLQLRERVSIMPTNMTLADLTSMTSEEAMDRFFGTNEEHVHIEDIMAANLPDNDMFLEHYNEMVKEHGLENVQLTRKVNGDFSMRIVEPVVWEK